MKMDRTKRLQPDVEQWIEKQPEQKLEVEISVVVPAYNEQWRLPTTLIDMIDYFDARQCSYEIIVVDDGSVDQTSDIVKKFEKIRSQVTFIRVPRNYGKGHAVRMGVLNAHGRKVLFADADGSTPISEIERLENALAQGADVAIGSRALASQDTVVTTNVLRKYFGRLFNFLVNVLVLPQIADTQCGFKMFTSKAARFLFERQKSDGFSFDVEILYMARRAGLKINEIPINWVNVPGSKVNLFLDPLRMLADIMLFRVRHADIGPNSYQ